MIKLRRYWFTFDVSPFAYPFGGWGCGVTAYTREDAEHILSERVFEGGPLPPLREVVEDIDVSTLDAGHIRPNMGACSTRGVWFPLGYW